MLAVCDLGVKKDTRTIIQSINFSCRKGHIGCFLGPSGSGKTTLVRAIAGLERIAAGAIEIDGKCVNNEHVHVAIEKRNCGMLFQDLALFPHLTVAQNVAFGIGHMPAQQKRNRVQHMLDAFNISQFANRSIDSLSGGQQQRIALARTLAPSPRLLLLDEPLSHQDYHLRHHLLSTLKRLITQEGITALVITHNQHEAFYLADMIGVLCQGQIMQWANAYDIYHKPAHRFVAEFIGRSVYIQGIVRSSHAIDTELGQVTGEMNASFAVGTEVDLLVRQDDIIHDDESKYVATVIDKEFTGADYVYTLRVENSVFLCSAPSHHNHAIGEAIGIRIDMHHLVAFSRHIGLL